MLTRENCRRVDLKRKVFTKGRPKQNFKRFKKAPKYVLDNVENKIAREKAKDVFDFSDSDEEQDDLGMGLDLSDLACLNDDNYSNTQQQLIALTQDSVRPMFINDTSYEESKLDDALAELRHSSFKPNQKEVIKRVLFGRSTLFISPTGSGKSLCYQLPALLYWRHRKYITIVVSPLISLMEDQMNNFPSALKAVSLHSGLNRQQRRRTIEQLVAQEAQVVFISPEAIVAGLLELEDLKSFPPVGFVCIDEAHCLSEWSHNFRPAYMQFLSILSEQLRIKTFLGLTATATKATSFAIAKCLKVNPENDVIGQTTVPENLILSVSHEINKEQSLIELLKSPTFKVLPSIIIYCNRREETERVASNVRTSMQNYSSIIEKPQRKKKTDDKKEQDDQSPDGDSSSPEKEHMKLPWNAEAYHAGLTFDTRKRIQRQFIKGEIRVVVATVAFGMGINKADIRAIIHYDMPSSFESYIQEIGRAGRDGKPAQCHMFLRADKTDLFYQQRNIYSSTTDRKYIKKLHDYLFKYECCRCSTRAKEPELDKLARLNESDPHKISSWNKTTFTNVPVKPTDDQDDIMSSDDESDCVNANQSVKYIHKSVVKKHRACKGHEVAFDIEEASENLNLRPESIITLMCQLEQAYPQLKIKQYTPMRSTCKIYCYKGSKQMEQLKKTCNVVGTAIFLDQMEFRKSNPQTNYEVPKKFQFDVVKVARWMHKPTADVIRTLKNLEWELVDKTGQFRRSQVRVLFEGNSFHLQCVGDLNNQEIEEIDNFLIDYMAKYEYIERNRLAKVYYVFKKHSIDVAAMKDRVIRFQTSYNLKSVLNLHFNPTVEQHDKSFFTQAELDSNQAISVEKEDSVRKDAQTFISQHSESFLPTAIARIFQGISSPKYPAQTWGMNRRWWRIHLDVDFVKLVAIIREVLMVQKSTNHNCSKISHIEPIESPGC